MTNCITKIIKSIIWYYFRKIWRKNSTCEQIQVTVTRKKTAHLAIQAIYPCPSKLINLIKCRLPSLQCIKHFFHAYRISLYVIYASSTRIIFDIDHNVFNHSINKYIIENWYSVKKIILDDKTVNDYSMQRES